MFDEFTDDDEMQETTISGKEIKIKELEWEKIGKGFIVEGPFGTFEAKRAVDGFIGEYYTDGYEGPENYESEGADSIQEAKDFCQRLLRKQVIPCLEFIELLDKENEE